MFCNNMCSRRCDKMKSILFPWLFTVLQKNSLYILVFDGFVILNCLASLILCSRSVVLALRLRQVSVVLIIPAFLFSLSCLLVLCSNVLNYQLANPLQNLALTVFLPLERMWKCLWWTVNGRNWFYFRLCNTVMWTITLPLLRAFVLEQKEQVRADSMVWEVTLLALLEVRTAL